MNNYRRYYHRGKKKKKKSRMALLIFLLLVILGVGLYQGYLWLMSGLTERAEEFMRDAASGRLHEAESLALGDNLPGIEEFVLFFQEPGISYIRLGTAGLSGFLDGRVEFIFSVDGLNHSADIILTRQGKEWRILSLPEISEVSGAMVVTEEDEELTVLWDGAEKIFELPAAGDFKMGDVVKAKLVGGMAVKVDRLEEVYLSRLLYYSEEGIEGEREGFLLSSGEVQFYRTEGDSVTAASSRDILIGLEDIMLFIDQGLIAAVVLEGEYRPETIRVALRRNLEDLSEESLRHRQLQIFSDTALMLEDRIHGESREYAKGDLLIIEPHEGRIKVTSSRSGDAAGFDNRIFFTDPGGARITVKGLSRPGWEGAAPSYPGSLDIVNAGGTLIVVNETTLEQYLYTVVPSEMPLSFGAGSLKVQAVAARSYALTNILSSRYRGYGAHVDDSVLSQVYNNTREYPLAREVVEATRGLVLYYGENVADARFFSTSCGYTANYHQVWHDSSTGKFPAEPVDYLKAQSQIPGVVFSLQNEEEVRFFLDQTDWEAYDRESPYFRWQVEMTAKELQASINNNLASRYREQPDFILTLEGGEFLSLEIPRNPLGTLVDLRVIERGEGGNIMILEVEGTHGTYRIKKEYNIRFTLRPRQYLEEQEAVKIKLHDGNLLSNHALLPSAFFYLDLSRGDEGGLEKVSITGGGNGHGVGMSQYGVRGMDALGYELKEILHHYYPGAELKNIYD